MSENFLTVENLSFKFPKAKDFMFKNLNFSFPIDQDIIVILGSNGTGKSLLAQLLVGLQKIHSGSIKYFDQELTKLSTSERIKYISLTFQMVNKSFIKDTVEQELLFALNLREKNTKHVKQVDDFTETFPLIKNSLKDKHPLKLSGGEKRLLTLQLIDITNPEIIILDEPTVGLDFFHIQELIKLIHYLKSKKKKIIVITHDLKFLLSICDYCILLEKDKSDDLRSITYQGSLMDLLLNNFNLANSILSIPIEFILFREKVLNKEFESITDYQTYLKNYM